MRKIDHEDQTRILEYWLWVNMQKLDLQVKFCETRVKKEITLTKHKKTS
jgi:hypothetical protein